MGLCRNQIILPGVNIPLEVKICGNTDLAHCGCVSITSQKLLAFLPTQCKVLLHIWNHQGKPLHTAFVMKLNLFYLETPVLQAVAKP